MRRVLDNVRAVLLTFAALYPTAEMLEERLDIQASDARLSHIAILDSVFGRLRPADEPASDPPGAPVFTFTISLNGSLYDVTPPVPRPM